MSEHTCEYCNGTLVSVRPLCPKCEHPLCQQIYNPEKGTSFSILEFLAGRRFDPIKDKITTVYPHTTCPKCFEFVYLTDNHSEVVLKYA